MSGGKVRTKDSCWFVGTIYDPRELPGVKPQVEGLDVVLQGGVRLHEQAGPACRRPKGGKQGGVVGRH
jgi:hypothetical protein